MANLVFQQYISNNDFDTTTNLFNNTTTSSISITTTSTTTYGNNKNEDRFGQIAKLISDCTYTRSEGGKIGWIERKDVLQNI